jgi:hypothetical protein
MQVTILRGLKLFAAFFLLFCGFLFGLATLVSQHDMSDNAALIESALLSIGATILWMDWKKN